MLVRSIANPLLVFEKHLLAAPIIELRCAAVSVAGDSLSDLQRSSVLQVVRDTGSSEGVGSLSRRSNILAASIRVIGRPPFLDLSIAVCKGAID
jgi:hypothetical protein